MLLFRVNYIGLDTLEVWRCRRVALSSRLDIHLCDLCQGKNTGALRITVLTVHTSIEQGSAHVVPVLE